MKEYFTIGEVSKLFQVKIATLRYYDQIGLLRPEFIDEKTNYRYYSTQQFERLNSIKYLRALDLPINEIIDFFNYREIDALVDMLKKQKDEVAKKKKELEIIETKISRRLLQIEDAVSAPLDQISEITLPEMHVAYLRHDYVIGDDIELPITELRNSFGIKEEIFLGKIGISISVSNLNNNVFDKYSSIFMILEDGDQIPPTSIVIPSRDYLKVRFKGTHIDAVDYYKLLLTYMKKHNYELLDDSFEITLIDYGLTNDKEKYVTEILLPYK
ncbi:MerR family transcriptional regulator [Gottfriedia sp. S16(2024)]|uniref:MerR family transcriptional regulator n=1 Tax=Gottfriedia sp. S16(2024) TaxID=3162883 RepID=UPI003D2189DC